MIVPTYVVRGVSGIDPEALRTDAGEVPFFVAYDLDRALTEHYGTSIPPEHLAVMSGVAACGMAQVVLSNAQSPERIERAQGIVADASERIGQEILCFVSGVEGGKRKPWPTLFDQASRALRLPGSRGIMVGDQIMKDVWGAWLAYGGSVLVAPYGNEDDPRVRVQRAAEFILRARMPGVPTLTRGFPEQMARVVPLPIVLPRDNESRAA